MKPFLITLSLLLSAYMCRAQSSPEVTTLERRKGFTNSFDENTRIISFGLGFPNLYRIRYDEPAGYTHIKTSGFGPMYAKFEFAAFRNVGLVSCFGYSTFHYSYFGVASHPTGPQQVIYYDDVNTLNLAISANYHFADWIDNPRQDLYAGLGVGVNYLKSRYGNIPPYRSPESRAELVPVIRAGGRYYLDPIFGLYGELEYDGLSILQLGFSVRF